MKPFKLASISDIHLGHPTNSTAKIISRLDKILSNDSFLKKIDLLILVGDVFDQLLNMSDPNGLLIDDWIARLLRICYRNKVTVRVVEGTPSHDRKQSTRFESINEINTQAGYGPTKLKYVSELSIEHIDEFDINVLYVPDEWGPTTDDTFDQVIKLMNDRQLETVDFAFMHGMFEHQLDIPGLPCHSSEKYLRIVKHLIFIGHIHKYSSFDRIYAQGSTDRLNHGEEEPKGFLFADILESGDYKVAFIENKEATIYKTIPVYQSDMVDALIYLEEEVKDFPAGSKVRIETTKGNSICANLSLVKERWPLFTWTLKNDEKVVKKQTLLIDHKRTYVPVQLNRQSLPEVMKKSLVYIGKDEETVERCDGLLKEAMGKVWN